MEKSEKYSIFILLKNMVNRVFVFEQATAILDQRNIDQQVKEKLLPAIKPSSSDGFKAQNSLFFVDTKGSSEGLSQSAKKAILKQQQLRRGQLETTSSKKAGKDGKPLTALQRLRQGKLSAFEEEKIAKRAQKDENYEKNKHAEKIYTKKNCFDLWGEKNANGMGDDLVKFDDRDMGETGTTKADRAYPVKKSDADLVFSKEENLSSAESKKKSSEEKKESKE